jgi:hypothetical protein
VDVGLQGQGGVGVAQVMQADGGQHRLLQYDEYVVVKWLDGLEGDAHPTQRLN